MFENLTARLTGVIKELRGHARLTEENLDAALRDVRMALLEADVALPVVREFLGRVRERALGRDVSASLTPGQEVIRIVRDELVLAIGEAEASLRLDVEPPAIILLAGLQGAGKTTTAAKLARWLREQQHKRVLLTSCDIYRPAAIEQLAVLARENEIEFMQPDAGAQPEAIAAAALQRARAKLFDVLIVDTAGRLHVDLEMMDEMRRLHAALRPTDTLFIVDSMMGQDALKAAAAFGEAVELTGAILTKADGDARGGAALSVRHVTGRPILFIGTGERATELAPFHAGRIVSRLLGMGDVLTLIEEVERRTDRQEAAALEKKIRKGKGLDLEDFRDQLRQMRGMGGIGALLDKLPGAAQMPPGLAAQVDDRALVRLEAIINSMTPRERRRPEIINGSRKRRIAAGSGTTIQDVNRLLKQFSQMQKTMKRLSRKGGLSALMRGPGGGFSGMRH
jgi:signal recognition particle subunit SRP54